MTLVVRNRISIHVTATNVNDHTNNLEPTLTDGAAPQKNIPKSQPHVLIIVTDGGLDAQLGIIFWSLVVYNQQVYTIHSKSVQDGGIGPQEAEIRVVIEGLKFFPRDWCQKCKTVDIL